MVFTLFKMKVFFITVNSNYGASLYEITLTALETLAEGGCKLTGKLWDTRANLQHEHEQPVTTNTDKHATHRVFISV